MQLFNLKSIAEKIYKEIANLPTETEFTLQQFIKDYNIDEKAKFSLCIEIFNYFTTNNVKIEEKYPDAVLGLPWNIPRIKK